MFSYVEEMASWCIEVNLNVVIWECLNEVNYWMDASKCGNKDVAEKCNSSLIEWIIHDK